MVEGIKMLFGSGLMSVHKNDVLHRGQDPHRKGQLSKSTGSLCCGVRSKTDHSVLNNGIM